VTIVEACTRTLRRCAGETSDALLGDAAHDPEVDAEPHAATWGANAASMATRERR
jgi:hypothetical protein